MYTYKKFLLGLFLISFFFLFPQKAFAVTVTIDSFPSTISSQNSFDVGVSILGAGNGTNYLRIDLFRDGTQNYFGETYNGTDWYSGSDGQKYFPVQVQNSTASATIKGQIGNPSSNDYPGPGSYKLKIRRYTSSGSPSSNDTQTSADIQITYATLPPTSSPTSVPTSVPTTTATATTTVAPTKTPTPRPSPTKTPSPKPSSSPEVMGENTSEPTFEPSPEEISETSGKKKFPFLPVILIGSGLSMVGLAVLQLINAAKNSKKNPPLGPTDNMGGSNI